MHNRKAIIEKLMAMESQDDNLHNFYFTGSSLPALEEYGLELVDKLHKTSKCTYKGIVKQFSITMPYFDDKPGADKFLNNLKESVSIAKDCYDTYTGFILIECDMEWSVRGLNLSIVHVLEYIKTLYPARFIVLFASDNDKKIETFYTALTTAGVWALVKIEEINVESYIEKWKCEISDAGFSIDSHVLEEMCRILENRQNGIADVESVFSQWLRQVRFNRMMENNDNKEITMSDIKLLSGVSVTKRSQTIGFGTAGR